MCRLAELLSYVDWIALSAVVGAVSAAVTARVAYLALRSWQEQLLGAESHEIAKKILLATKAVRVQFMVLRSRLFQKSFEEWLKGESVETPPEIAIYRQRYKDFVTLVSKLEGLLVEADVLWDGQVSPHIDALVAHDSEVSYRFAKYLGVVGRIREVGKETFQEAQTAFLGKGKDGEGDLRDSFLAYLTPIESIAREKKLGRKRRSLMRWIDSLRVKKAPSSSI
jgi:hypothetical protein